MESARRWTTGAFVVLGISMAIQLLVALPMQLEYHTILRAQMLTQNQSVHLPAAFSNVMTAFTSASMWIGLFGGFFAMASWPIVLRVQATRWLRGQA